MRRTPTKKIQYKDMKRKEYKENLTGSLPSAQRGKVKFKVKYKGTHTIQPTTRQTTTTYYYIYYYYILPTTTYYYYLPYTMSANANASSKRPRQSADKTFDPRDEAKKPAKKTKPAPTVAPKPKATGPVTGPRPTTQAQAQAQAQAHPDPQPEDSSIRTEQELNAEARQTALDRICPPTIRGPLQGTSRSKKRPRERRSDPSYQAQRSGKHLKKYRNKKENK